MRTILAVAIALVIASAAQAQLNDAQEQCVFALNQQASARAPDSARRGQPNRCPCNSPSTR